MNLTDELTKLQALHDSGTLTDTEFADAKAKVLAESQPEPSATDKGVQHDLRCLQIQNEILSLDQSWSVERESYMLHGRYGSRVVPSAARSTGSAIFVGVVFFGLLILGMSAPHGGVLIVIGLLGIALAVGSGLSGSSKAAAYNAADEQYQQKRNALSDDLAALD